MNRYGRLDAHAGETWGPRPEGVTMVLQYKPQDEAGTGYSTTTFDTVPTHVSTCPDCDSDVVDGQGVLGCVGSDCEWAGFVA